MKYRDFDQSQDQTYFEHILNVIILVSCFANAYKTNKKRKSESNSFPSDKIKKESNPAKVIVLRVDADK